MNIFDRRPHGRLEDARAVSRAAQLLPALLRAHEGLEIVGANPLTATLAAKAGLEPLRLVFEGIVLAGRRIELVAFSRRELDQSAEKIASFKRLARDSDLVVAMVPPSVMSRQMPWNCNKVGTELRPALSAAQRMAIWLHVLENRGSTLAACVGSMNHSDPVAAVLSSAIDGVISLDCGDRLAPTTQVSLPNFC